MSGRSIIRAAVLLLVLLQGTSGLRVAHLELEHVHETPSACGHGHCHHDADRPDAPAEPDHDHRDCDVCQLLLLTVAPVDPLPALLPAGFVGAVDAVERSEPVLIRPQRAWSPRGPPVRA